MKRKIAGYLILAGAAGMITGMTGYAAEYTGASASEQGYIQADTVICDGVYAGEIDLSGMTVAEAESAIDAYIESCGDTEITLQAGEDYTVTVTAAELGLSWGNPEILEEAAGIGKKGNIVKRYMEMTDLSYENRIFDISLSFDRRKIRAVVAAQSEMIDVEAVNATLTRENEEFLITPGVDGAKLDVQESVDLVYQYLMEEWNGATANVDLAVEVIKPELCNIG